MGDRLQQCIGFRSSQGHGSCQLDRELRLTRGKVPWDPLNDPETSDKQLHRKTGDWKESVGASVMLRVTLHMSLAVDGELMCWEFLCYSSSVVSHQVYS